MSDAIVSFVGSVSGASVTGASHVAGGKPNQDAAGWSQSRLWTYLAVADGHGAPPHYRSDRGSRMAVDALLALFLDVTGEGTLRDPSALAGRLPDLAAALVERWREKVDVDIGADPVPESPGFDRLAVYGSTCLGAAVGPGFALFLQIGDGGIFVGSPSGEVEVLFPGDDYEGEETDSLCLPEVASRMRLALFTAPSHFCAPDFVLAATDGVTKSYPDADALLAAVRACRDAVGQHDLARVADELAPWLAACAERGNGDDATVALFAYQPGSDRSAFVEVYSGSAPPVPSYPSAAPPPAQKPRRRRGASAATAFGFLAGLVVGHWGPPLVARLAPPASPAPAAAPAPASSHSTRGLL